MPKPATTRFPLVLPLLLALAAGAAAEDKPFSYFPDIAAPDLLQVIDRADMNLDEYLMMLSLQGLLAQEKPRIYITGHHPAYALWLEKMRESYGVTTAPRNQALALLNEFKQEVSGYILCKYGTPSVNSATSLAGIRNAIVVTEALRDQVEALGLPMILDTRNMDPGSVFQNYKNEFENSLIFTADHGTLELRDLVVATKGFIYHETAEIAGNFFNEEEVYGWAGEDAPHIGWGGVNKPDEADFVGDASRRGLFTIPANHTVNLSTLLGLKKDSLTQKSFPADSGAPAEAHYLAFLMSDGDNVSFVLHGLASDPLYFGNSHRGAFPMNWTMPTTLIDLAPAALEWYYENAEKDYFVSGGSGNGYMYPSQYPDLATHARRLNGYIERNGMPYVGILDFPMIGGGDFHRAASAYAKQPNLKGAFYVNYQDYALGAGEIRFVGGKPFVAMRENLWETDPVAMAHKINGHSRNPADPKAYTIMNIHAWSHDLDDVATVVANLAPHVKVVNLDTLFQLVERNLDPAPLALPDRNFAALYDEQSGVASQGGILAFINTGDHAVYRNINFGERGIKTIRIRASSETGGGRIDIRLGGAAGPLLGSVTITGTSGWQNFQTFSGGIGELEGRGDLHFSFEGSDHFLFNLDWFEFTTKPIISPVTRPSIGLRFATEPGKSYLITSTPDLDDRWWSAASLIEGSGNTAERYFSIKPAGREFFRILSN